jgi:hypothetical protein
MSAVKEPRFFAPDLYSRFAGRNGGGPARLHTLEGYLELFADARPDQRAGEASPVYLRSTEAARRIAEVRPDAQIIAILREPADFLRSLHLQMVSSNEETERDFRRAMALEDKRRAGKRVPRNAHHPKSLLYSSHVRYAEQLQRFHGQFPKENVLVLIYDDFRADNEATLRTVLGFLGVDTDRPMEQVETLRLKAVRSPGLHRLANSARLARLNPAAASHTGRVINALTPALHGSERFRSSWRRIAYSEPRPPEESFMRELRQRFKPEVVAISDYLGVDLVSRWGYGDID